MTSNIPPVLIDQYHQTFQEKAMALSALLDELNSDDAFSELHHFVYQLNSSAIAYGSKPLSGKTYELMKLVEQSDVNAQDVLSCGQQLIQLLQHP